MSQGEFSQSKLLAMVGPTASGKTRLAVEIAKRFSGEIISADSRAIFREMNIGTAKPSLKDRENIPHWGIDIVNPDEKFTVADFQKYAETKICEISERNKLPILVGGSGLYIDSIIFNYEFSNEILDSERAIFEKMGVNDLQNYCRKNNILLPENYKNKRYLINAILRKNVVKNNRKEMRKNTLVLGLNPGKEVLLENINRRIHEMFANGVEDETANLVKKYHINSEAMKANIYQIIYKLQNGEIDREEAKKNASISDLHLAKKQLTWFRRNKFIQWITEKKSRQITDNAEQIVSHWLCD